MSLDNVFMGKKVVQQIYLKNALIYQSKGWETLPSAPQVEWTKSFGIWPTDYSSFDFAIDKENNIYICFIGYIYKISSEGVLIWKKTMYGSNKICIDQNNNIYLAQCNSTNNTPFINQLDTSGNIIKRIQVHNTRINATGISGFTYDRNYLYIASYMNADGTNIFLHKVDKNLNNSVNLQFKGNEMGNLTTSLDSPYLYYGLEYLYQIKKEVASKPTNIRKNSSIQNIITDNLDNVIFSNVNNTYKYNIESQQITEIPIVSSNGSHSICLDYQQNLYSLKLQTQHLPSTANLVKTSSDGTLIYNIQIIVNDSITGLDLSNLIVDNNGNIYVAYQNDNKELLITKIINLVKKGN